MSRQRTYSIAESQALPNKKVLCIFNNFGKCRKGSLCGFAHDPEELMDAKSVMCPVFLQIRSCSDPLCPFSHSVDELRPADRVVKPVLCKYWRSGKCRAGYLCRHAHGSEELPTSEEDASDPNFRTIITPKLSKTLL